MSESRTAGQPRLDPEALRRAARSIQHPLARALLVLTFTTGLVDAVSYLGLGRVFTANMTGNVVLLGFGLAASSGLPVLAPVISLGCFMVGAGAGGVLVHRVADHHPGLVTRALATEAVLLTLAAVLAAIATFHPGDALACLLIALMAFAMGVRNSVVRQIRVPDL